MEKKTLNTLTLEARELSDKIHEAGGEITPELDQALQINNTQIAVKVDNYAAFIKNCEAAESYWGGIEEEARRMRKGYTNARDMARERMKTHLELTECDEIQGDLFRFSISNSRPALMIDENQLEDKFKMTVTETIPDKEAIRKALESGEMVKGARLNLTKALRMSLAKM